MGLRLGWSIWQGATDHKVRRGARRGRVLCQHERHHWPSPSSTVVRLREMIRRRRVAALVAGFGGGMIVLRPGISKALTARASRDNPSQTLTDGAAAP
ncbi:MAG: hypothetical protein GKR94_01910 [Gammaproteobacteria bacterium]|nr:hypothetical protein [Gammaproteobacteria bacterium]